MCPRNRKKPPYGEDHSHDDCELEQGHGTTYESPPQQRANARAMRRAIYGHRRTGQQGIRDVRALEKQRSSARIFRRHHPLTSMLPGRVYRLHGINPTHYRHPHHHRYWRIDRIGTPRPYHPTAFPVDSRQPNSPSHPRDQDLQTQAHQRLLSSLVLPPPPQSIQVMIAGTEDSNNQAKKPTGSKKAKGKKRATEDDEEQGPSKQQKRNTAPHPDLPQCDQCHRFDPEARDFDGKQEGSKICAECFNENENKEKPKIFCDKCNQEGPKRREKPWPNQAGKKICRPCSQALARLSKADDVGDSGFNKKGPYARVRIHPKDTTKRVCIACYAKLKSAASAKNEKEEEETICDGCRKKGPARRRQRHPDDKTIRICNNCYS